MTHNAYPSSTSSSYPPESAIEYAPFGPGAIPETQGLYINLIRSRVFIRKEGEYLAHGQMRLNNLP